MKNSIAIIFFLFTKSILSQFTSVEFSIQFPSSLSGLYLSTNTGDSTGTSAPGWSSTPDMTNPSNAILGTLMMVEDGTPGINSQGNPISQEGCSPLINDLSGKIAVIWRNTCQFGEKILNAQNAGAIGAIIINREPGLVNMAPADSGYLCTIPAVFIDNNDGITIVNEMANGPVIGQIGAYDHSIVTITHKVDVRDYLSQPSIVLDTAGIRIGGEFLSYKANVNGTNMVDWTPSDPTSAMSDLDGDSIWEISITYPSTYTGDTIEYKFVNGDWGTNEVIYDSSCGGLGTNPLSGLTYGNRFFILPNTDTIISKCWNSCTSYCCTNVTFNDTTNIFVSDSQFQIISPHTYLVSSNTFPRSNHPNCDSTVTNYRNYIYNPNYYSDTITTQVVDSLTIYDTTYISISVTDTLYIDITVTVFPNIDNTISVYPNPANDVVIIDNGNYNIMSNYSLVILNSLSQQVFSSQINTQQFQIPVSTLGAEGTYFIQIFDGNNNLVITKYLVLN